jgi:hypothetical protein
MGAFEAGFSLNAAPTFRSIEAGSVTSYTVGVSGIAGGGVVTLTTASPSLSLTLHLAPPSLTPPGTAILTVTDTHPTGPLMPGVFYAIPITGTDNGLTQTISVSLLVGGSRTYLPLILKQ